MTYTLTHSPNASLRSKRAIAYLRVSTKEQAQTNERDGYSIDTQRDMVDREAIALNSVIEQYFIDPGASGTTIKRKDLQRMLAYLGDNPGIDYVIVPWLDRLSRKALDSLMLKMQIEAHGAELVSCSEKIDRTPTGKFLHLVMVGKGELDNDDRTERIKGGMRTKAMQGGTPGRAKVGYLNQIERVGGRELRIVVPDPDRHELVAWGLQTFNTGSWTVSTLHDELVRRGLTAVPRSGRPAVPIPRSSVGSMLRDPYYTGVVVWDGVEYPGQHESLITREVYQRNLELLKLNAHTGERRQRRTHFLKGTIFCHRCEHRMSVSPSRGNGGLYLYAFCLRRHTKGTCDQPYSDVTRLERDMQDRYANLRIDPAWRVRLVGLLRQENEREQDEIEAEVRRQERRIRDLHEELRGLLPALKRGVLVEVIEADEQRIKAEIKEAEGLVARLRAHAGDELRLYEDTERLIDNLPKMYRRATDEQRRHLNHFFFARAEVDDGRIVGVVLTPEAAAVLGYSVQRAADAGEAHKEPWTPRAALLGGPGSNVDCLVAPTGFEPAPPP